MPLGELPDRIRRTARQRAVPVLLVSSLLVIAIGAAISMLGAHGQSTQLDGGAAGGAGADVRTRNGGAPSGAATAAAGVPSGAELYVHVTGAVNRPGLVTLAVGTRVVDAIAAAGGLSAGADAAAINLARELRDGEQVVVPKQGEAPAGGGVGSSGGGAGSASGLVNLNSADQAALEALPHIGPALAARIIAWRKEHGGFTSIDDLREVSGIGEKTFADLAPLVTVS